MTDVTITITLSKEEFELISQAACVCTAEAFVRAAALHMADILMTMSTPAERHGAWPQFMKDQANATVNGAKPDAADAASFLDWLREFRHDR